MQGKIIKGVGGFYYIHLHHDKIYECRAKGAFRNQNIKPAVGDDVEIDIISEEKQTGNIINILPRKNLLLRPTVANVDQGVIIFALAQPKPNFNLLDRFLIMMDRQGVKTIICLNKGDLADPCYADEIKNIYQKCGYEVIVTSAISSDAGDKYFTHEISRLNSLIEGKTSVFAGPSGVGKSSIINLFNPMAGAKTGEISEKIKRGKHTTRHSELIWIKEDTYIMDTPGFSSLYVEDMEENSLKDYYNEFAREGSSCRFNGCVHINEPDCGIKLGVMQGSISRLRYDNYVQLYQELKDKRRW